MVLLVAAGWIILPRSGDRVFEHRESPVQSSTVESSVQTEEAEGTAPLGRDTKSDLAASASLANSPSHDGRSVAGPEAGNGSDAALDDLQEKIRSADALPAERRFVSSGHLDAETSMEALGSDEFSKAIEELAREAYGDFDAQALSDVYGEYVGGFLAAGDGFALDRLVCGMRVCMGEAVSLSDAASWPDLALYSSRYEGPPMFASAYGHFVDADGLTIYQFIFTTDPESRGIVVPPP